MFVRKFLVYRSYNSAADSFSPAGLVKPILSHIFAYDRLHSTLANDSWLSAMAAAARSNRRHQKMSSTSWIVKQNQQHYGRSGAEAKRSRYCIAERTRTSRMVVPLERTKSRYNHDSGSRCLGNIRDQLQWHAVERESVRQRSVIAKHDTVRYVRDI